MIKFRLGLNLLTKSSCEPHEGVIGEGSEMEMKSRFVQLCVDVSTWSMVAIFRLGRIRVKGEIVRNCDWNTS